MRPAQWPAVGRQAAIDRPAIATDDAVDRLAQKRRQSRQAAAGIHDEGGRCGRGRQPQPAALARLLPARLIDVLEATDVMAAAEVGEGGDQAWTETVGAEVRRDGRPRDDAAVGTGARVPLILRNLDHLRRQFGDLMPGGFGVGGRRFGRQGSVTGRARRGHEGYDLGDPMAGQAEENGAGMARLSTGLASARLLGDGRRSGGRVGRRRQGRVGGVQAEPRLRSRTSASSSARRPCNAARLASRCRQP
jgi:hypothetical protein